MADIKIAKEWFDKADEDFNFAAINLENLENTYYSQICFHFQQAAEKYLKAFIVAKDLEFIKVHDLTKLLNICSKSGADLEMEEECIFLTDFYIETRYPVHWPVDINREEALKAKQYAEKIKLKIKKLLNEECS